MTLRRMCINTIRILRNLSFTLLPLYYYIHCINIHYLFVFFFPNKFVYFVDSSSLANVHVSLNDIEGLISRLAICLISPSFRFSRETNIITCSVSLKKRRKHSVEPHLQLRILAACQALPRLLVV